jgi:hypothetical protein
VDESVAASFKKSSTDKAKFRELKCKITLSGLRKNGARGRNKPVEK